MKIISSNIFKGDKVIWGIIFILSVFSLLAVYSSTGTLVFKNNDISLSYYLLKHGGILIMGLIIILFFQNIPFSIYNKLSYLLIFITIPVLFYTLFKGTNINEASRWITLPVAGISFQSSDLAKFSLIVFISRFLAKYQQNTNTPEFKRDFKIVVTTIFIICGLILPANFSTAAMLFFVSIILLFLGRIKFKYILSVVGIATLITGLFLTIAFVFFPDKGRVQTWKNRIETYLNSDKVDSDDKYQIEQSKIAIASGGIFGKGPGNSTQRNFLPHPYSDFIFSIIVEEYGIIFGALIIILSYMILLYRVGVIVNLSKRAFPSMLAIGLIIVLVTQAMINMGVATAILPVTGQTLPLVSMGGTSIIFTSVSLGIILNITDSIKKNIEQEKEAKKDNSDSNINAENNINLETDKQKTENNE
jgi:cell division protein FtsW